MTRSYIAAAMSVVLCTLLFPASASAETQALNPAGASVSGSPEGTQHEFPRSDRSAVSCQATIGPLGATQCFTAVSPGLLPSVRIVSLQLEYFAGANVCNKHYQFRYRLAGQSANTTTSRSDSSCSYGYATNKLTLNRDMHNGSQVCARQRNSATNQTWTNWYCHTVWG